MEVAQICRSSSWNDIGNGNLFATLYSFNQARKSNTTINLVSFASESILNEYATYSFAINTLYSYKRGYSYNIFTPSESEIFDSVDFRWSRVKIIDWMFHQHSSTSTPSYFVWLDADFIFLDFNFNLFSDVIQFDNRTKNADIIISAEYHAETGVANTGCFIIRNSTWSQQFVIRWWNNDASVRKSAHDQVFFDRLYKKYLEEDPEGTLEHIVILPTRVLNSMPPAILQLRDSDRVLHLMGESNGLRGKVFSFALKNWCQNNEIRQTETPKPLNITPDSLLDLSYSWYSEALLRNLDSIDRFTTRFVGVEKDFSIAVGEMVSAADSLIDNIGEARELLLQLRKMELKLIHLNQNLVIESLQTIFNVVLFVSKYFQRLHSTWNEAQYFGDAHQNRQRSLDWNNMCSLIGNDFLVVLSEIQKASKTEWDLEKRASLYEAVEGCLEAVEAAVAHSSKAVILSSMAIFLQNKGQFYLSLADPSARLEGLRLLQRSFDILWEELPAEEVNPFQQISPALVLGSALCEGVTSQEEVGKGAVVLARLIGLMEKLLSAEEQLKEDHLQYVAAIATALICEAKAHQSNSSSTSLNYTNKLVKLRKKLCLNLLESHGSSLCEYVNAILMRFQVEDMNRSNGDVRSLFNMSSTKKKVVKKFRKQN